MKQSRHKNNAVSFGTILPMSINMKEKNKSSSKTKNKKKEDHLESAATSERKNNTGGFQRSDEREQNAASVLSGTPHQTQNNLL